MKKFINTLVATSTVFLGSASFAMAQGSDVIDGLGLSGDLITFIKQTLNTIIGLGALVAVAILVFNGIQYMIANGDEGKIEKATKGITWAIIGLVVTFISALIVNFVLTRILGQ